MSLPVGGLKFYLCSFVPCSQTLMLMKFNVHWCSLLWVHFLNSNQSTTHTLIQGFWELWFASQISLSVLCLWCEIIIKCLFYLQRYSVVPIISDSKMWPPNLPEMTISLNTILHNSDTVSCLLPWAMNYISVHMSTLMSGLWKPYSNFEFRGLNPLCMFIYCRAILAISYIFIMKV